jgi:hypothetical protein
MRASLARGLKFALNPARTLPTMPWSARRSEWSKPRLLTLAVLISALWLFGIGEAGLINARLGNTPWTVLAQGVAVHSPLDIGGATILISVVVLLGWIPLRQRPGIGTVANVVVLRAPAAVKARIDVWGAAPDAAAVMRAIKTALDPAGILNAGRGPV